MARSPWRPRQPATEVGGGGGRGRVLLVTHTSVEWHCLTGQGQGRRRTELVRSLVLKVTDMRGWGERGARDGGRGRLGVWVL
jgi:hypothetical protein